ncbi:hypothetical protein M427DRAFT_133397 [Gonapodya prolifera JEL478]|uniref:WD40 repeat-like protein n=1 Tax=Gonapodya prolifera (strain JEL478) TaxID=1344416 RepID=A0A139AM53_GONPJ|nr:hypothetical protein M427DRAFT_133397 [Gonapodya prolifera JEL478]|eukprot:KXS17593.1 hypothetical protein M427DRAFT_133397 [Gonapodya prolifera JEL478]
MVVQLSKLRPPVPPLDSVTACEINDELVHIRGPKDEDAHARYLHANLPLFPNIVVPFSLPLSPTDPTDTPHHDASAQENPFLDPSPQLRRAPSNNTARVSIPLLNTFSPSQYSTILKEQVERFRKGLPAKVFPTASSHDATTGQEATTTLSTVLSTIGHVSASAAQAIGSALGIFQRETRSHDTSKTPVLPHQEILRQSSPVVYISCHSFLQIIAFVHRDGSLFIRDLGKQDGWWPTSAGGFTNRLMKSPTCVEWRPMSGHELIVGCSTGLLLLKLASLTSTTSAPMMEHYDVPSVSCLAWHPRGRFLAFGSATKPGLGVLDATSGELVWINKASGGPTRGVLWSPDGEYLAQWCSAPFLRLWSSRSWQERTLSVPRPLCGAVWLADSRTILYAGDGSTLVECLAMRESRVEGSESGVEYFHMPDRALDVTGYVGDTVDGYPVSLAGPISCIHLSPTGQRLLLSFYPSSTLPEQSPELLAVFSVSHARYDPRFTPLGYARGPKWNETENDRADRRTSHEGTSWRPRPICVTHMRFDRGTLSLIAWENGKIGFVPHVWKNTPGSEFRTSGIFGGLMGAERNNHLL